MDLLSDYAEPAEDLGEWFVFAEDKKTGETVRVRVRQIPPAVERAIERRHTGNKKKVLHSRKGTMVEMNNDREQEELVAKAAYALTDSENFEVRAGDKGAAEFYSRVTGATVEPGKLAKLDGHWGEELRRRICGASNEFRNWVLSKARVVKVAAMEEEEAEEEGKDES